MRLRKITYVLFVIIMMFVFSSCKKECKHVSSDWIVDATETCTKKGSKHTCYRINICSWAQIQ